MTFYAHPRVIFDRYEAIGYHGRMSRESKPSAAKSQAEHPEVANALTNLGSRIRSARIARNITIEEMSARMGVQPKTLSRLETGAPGVSIETLALALWQMNLLEHMQELAAPQNDPEGQRLAAIRLPRKARGKTTSITSGWETLERL